MTRKNITEYCGDLEELRKKALTGIMLSEAEEIARPKVNARIAVSKDRRSKTRSLLRSMGCIPHKEPEGYVYVYAGNMTPAHARDAIERRQKHCAGLIKNSVSIALTESRQLSVVKAEESRKNCLLLLEGTLEALDEARDKINREISALKGACPRKQKKAS